MIDAAPPPPGSPLKNSLPRARRSLVDPTARPGRERESRQPRNPWIGCAGMWVWSCQDLAAAGGALVAPGRKRRRRILGQVLVRGVRNPGYSWFSPVFPLFFPFTLIFPRFPNFFTRLYQVLPVFYLFFPFLPTFSPVLPSFYLVFPGFTQFSRFLSSFTFFCPSFYPVLPGFSHFPLVFFPHFPRF